MRLITTVILMLSLGGCLPNEGTSGPANVRTEATTDGGVTPESQPEELGHSEAIAEERTLILVDDDSRLSATAKSFFDVPSVDALKTLADEHEPTQSELKTAGLFWAFVIAAQAGEPLSPVFFYPEFQAEVKAIGLQYPSLIEKDNSPLGSMQQPLIRRGQPFECGTSCVPDPADFLTAVGEGMLDLAINDGFIQLKKATQTLSKTLNRAQRFRALADGANDVNALGGATSAAERAYAVAQARMGISTSDAMDIAGGVISGLGLLGVQSARLTLVGMVVTAFGAGTKIGDAIYQAQRLVEDCWRFQSEECDCGNEQLDPGETCDYAMTDSCYFGDHDLCEPVEGQCMAPRVIGDPRACNEECTPKPIDYCENDDGCCPEGCMPDKEGATYSLRDNDCETECGNGIVEFGEQCDGDDFGTQTCETMGQFDGGNLSCSADCQVIQTDSCTLCGNALAESGELCDIGDLRGETCETQGAGVGELRCDLNRGCRAFDTSRCTCGNGVIDDGEECDGVNLNDQTCESLGQGPGDLACNSECKFERSACTERSDKPIQCFRITTQREQCQEWADEDEYRMPTCETVEDIATRCFYVVGQSFFVPIHKCGGFEPMHADLPLVSQEMLPGEVVKLTFRGRCPPEYVDCTDESDQCGLVQSNETCEHRRCYIQRRGVAMEVGCTPVENGAGLRQLTAEQAGRIGGHCRDNIQAWRNGVPDNVVCRYRREEYQCGTDEGDTVCVDERASCVVIDPVTRHVLIGASAPCRSNWEAVDTFAPTRLHPSCQCARDHELPASNLPCQ